MAATGGGTPGTVYYVVRRVAPVTGRDLRKRAPTLDENNLPAVSFTLNQDGARRFGQLTEQNIGRQLAIILDNRVFSAPTIQARITDEGRITGSFTQQEAQDLVARPAHRRAAGVAGLSRRAHGRAVARRRLDPRGRARRRSAASLLVVLFMLFYYKLTGLNAVISIVVNLLILLGHDGVSRRDDDAAGHCRASS